MKKGTAFLTLWVLTSFSLFLENAETAIVHRQIIENNTCIPSVSISVTPLVFSDSYAVSEKIPMGLNPFNISENGQWHSDQMEIRWGNFRDHTARILTYQLTGVSADYLLKELTFSADGMVEDITSSTSVSIQCTPTQSTIQQDEPQELLEALPAPLFYLTNRTVPTSVYISSTVQGSVTYYTTDGSRPNMASQVFSESLEVNQPKLLRAIVKKSGMADSSVSSIRLSEPESAVPQIDLSWCHIDQCAPSVCFSMTKSVKAYALEISVPEGLTPHAINENGQWLPENRMIRWGTFKDGMARSLSCSLTGDNGSYAFHDITYSENGTPFDLTLTRLTLNCSKETSEIQDDPDQYETISSPIIHSISNSQAFEFSITCNSPDTKIYYTSNGSRPTKNSLVYSSPVSLTHGETIRAIAIKNDELFSETAMMRYETAPTVPAFGQMLTYVNNNGNCLPEINISLRPNLEIQTWAMDISLPEDVTPVFISQSGIYNHTQNSIKWGNYRDNNSRDFSFRLYGNNQEAVITGIVSFDGQVQTISDIGVVLACQEGYSITNQPPLIQKDADWYLLEDTPGELFFHVSDPDTPVSGLNIMVTANCSELMSSMRFSVNTLSSQQKLYFSPAMNESGTCPISITVTDQTNIVSEKFLLNIISVDDPPKISVISSQKIYGNDLIKEIPFKVTDIDSPADKFSFIANSSNSAVLPVNNIHISGNGENRIIRIQPTTNDLGNITVFLAIFSGSKMDSTTFELSFNHEPVAVGDSLALDEKRHMYILLTATDKENDPLTYTLVTLPSHGSVTLDGDVAIYTPTENYNGMDRFSFSASDGFSDSNTASIVLTIHSVEVEQYRLKLVDMTGNGIISVNNDPISLPWESKYIPDSKVILFASPLSEWRFEKWSGDLSESTSNPVTITMDQDKVISPHFVPPWRKLTILGHQQVQINGELLSLPVEKFFFKGSQINLSAFPQNLFLGWTGDYVSCQASMAFQIEDSIKLTALFKDDQEWKISLRAETLNLSEKYSDTIILGVSVLASTEPDQLSSVFGCSLLTYSPDNTICSKDIRASGESEYYWTIGINPHGNVFPVSPRGSIIRWDPNQFSAKGFYRLHSGLDQNGTIVIDNMRIESEYTVTGGDSMQYFTLVWSTRNQKTFHMVTQKGWNLISLPVIPDNNDIHHLFPGAEQAYEYQNDNYVNVDQLFPGKGYWIYVTKNAYDITGAPFTTFTHETKQGWQLMGGLSIKVSDPFPEACVREIYSYKNGAFNPVSELLSGIGYWVHFCGQ